MFYLTTTTSAVKLDTRLCPVVVQCWSIADVSGAFLTSQPERIGVHFGGAPQPFLSGLPKTRKRDGCVLSSLAARSIRRRALRCETGWQPWHSLFRWSCLCCSVGLQKRSRAVQPVRVGGARLHACAHRNLSSPDGSGTHNRTNESLHSTCVHLPGLFLSGLC